MCYVKESVMEISYLLLILPLYYSYFHILYINSHLLSSVRVGQLGLLCRRS